MGTGVDPRNVHPTIAVEVTDLHLYELTVGYDTIGSSVPDAFWSSTPMLVPRAAREPDDDVGAAVAVDIADVHRAPCADPPGT